MNKNLYRIIFNKKRGCMMAVAENTTREGKSPQDSTCVATSILSAVETGLPGLTAFLVLMSGIGFAHAQIISDRGAPANQQAVILKTSAGAPLINIQTPNAKGLSHNRYTQFDVDAKGAVLNNSRTGNPHLAKGAAQIILNEIRSNNPSKLGGMVSVEGAKADVIIANPSGIQVNGGGFKNAGRAVLTTGTPVLKDGTLGGFDVRKGTVTVGSSGLDSRQTDFTEILARAAAIQGKTQSSHLAVSTGPQKTDYQSGEITAGIAEGTKPATGIDTAALGGMYANSITLIANEKGVGVKNAGTLEAQRQLVVTSAGRIENSGNIRTVAASAKDAPTYLGLEATESGTSGAVISNGGTIESKGLLVVESGEDIGLRNGAVIQNTGETETGLVLNAGRNLIIEESAAVNNSKGSIYMDSGAKTVVNNASISASSSSIRSHSKADTVLQTGSRLNAKGDVAVLSNSNIGVDGAITSEIGNIHVEAAKPSKFTDTTETSNVDINNGSLTAAKNIVILAESNINAQTSAVKSAENLYLHADKNLILTVDTALPSNVKNVGLKAEEKTTIQAKRKVTQALRYEDFDKNVRKHNISVAENLEINSGSIFTDSVLLQANSGNIALVATKGNIDLEGDIYLKAGKNIDISALSGNITAENIRSHTSNGYISILGHGDVHLKNTPKVVTRKGIFGIRRQQPRPDWLNANTDINVGSTGKGRLHIENANINAATGDVRLLSGGAIELGNDIRHTAVNGNNINIESKQNTLTAKNLTLTAKTGSLSVKAKQDLKLEDVQSSSKQNTVISSNNGAVRLNQVTASSDHHLAISSTANQVLQNRELTTSNNLKANGILSIHSRWWNYANNAQLQGGAVHLKSEKGSVNLSETAHVKAVSNNVLKNNTNLKSLDGDINIEAGQQVYLAPNKSIQADGDLSIYSKEKLTIAGKSGTKGVSSAQASSLTAKGEIKLIAGEADIQGASISAGKDLNLATTKGQLKIGAIRNTFNNYLPGSKVAELRRDIQKLEKQIAETRNTNPQDKRLAAWDNEKGRLEFYIQAIHKQVNNSLPRGYEYKQAVLTGQNINLLSAQGIHIRGSDVTAEKILNIQAAGLLPAEGAETQAAVKIDSASDHYEIGLARFKSHYDISTLNKPSVIRGKQGVNIYAPFENPNANIIVRGSQIDAPAGAINIKAYGDVLLENGLNDSYTFWKVKSKRGGLAGAFGGSRTHSDRTHLIMPAATELTSGEGIRIEAGRNIDAYSTQFYAPKGKINLIAGEELNLYAVEGKHLHHHETNKTTRFVGIKIKNKDYKKQELTHTKLPVKVIANGVNTRSGWDTVLEGTEFQTMLEGADIRAGVGDKARADAKIILQGIVTHVQTEENSTSNSTVWQSMAGKGSTVETLSLPTFEGPQAPVLSAPGGFIVDIPKGNFKTEIEKLVKQPQYAYLKQLQVSKDVKWNEIQLAYDSWNYKQEGLTGAGAAIIALAVAVATGGAGAGVGATIIGAAQGTAAAAMANTAFVSLVTQASIATINHKGNPRKVLKELGSSRTVKNLATAVITAGVANKIGASSALNQVSDKAWVRELTVNLATAGSSAAISTAINGGSLKDNLEASILSALVQTGHGYAASKIKYINGEAWYRNVAHKIAHAVAGCAAAEAGKNKCQDGAIGAAVGEIVGEALVNNTDFSGMTPEQIAKEKAKIVDYAKLAAGTVVGVTGGDVNAAAQTAQTAVEKNTLLGDELRDEIESLRKRFRTEKEAKDFLDILRNASVNVAAAGADGAVGTLDYGIDNLNAAFYCLGFTPGYCSMAHETLAPKNKVIVDTALASIDPKTYKNIVRTVSAAYDGDSAAGEAVGAFLISSIKKKPNAKILDGYLNKVPNGSNIPVLHPKTVKFNTGETVTYQSNPKHTPGQSGWNPKAGLEPKDSLKLFEQSVPISSNQRMRFAQDKDGNIHRFYGNHQNEWHWTGSTGDQRNPLKLNNHIKAQLRLLGWKGKVLK